MVTRTRPGCSTLPRGPPHPTSPPLLLKQGNGTRLILGGSAGVFISPSRPGRAHYFLTSIENADGQTLASIKYSQPTGCPAGAAGTSPGVPYIDMVRVAGPSQSPGVGSLKFYYRSLTNSISGLSECVLDRVTTLSSVTGPTQYTEAPVASFTYRPGANGLEQPGL